MKKKIIKNLGLLAIVMLTICLMSYALDRIAPASIVHAAGETQPSISQARPAERAASIPLIPSTQPVVSIVIGLVCLLFGLIAVSPLLITDPELNSQEPLNRKDPHELGDLVTTQV